MSTALDPRTPVLVGVAAINQRGFVPAPGDSGGPAASLKAAGSLEAAGLMAAAAEAAAIDAGTTKLLRSARQILVPRGSWSYQDAARRVAAAIGNAEAKTVIADLGVLQTTLWQRAASAIAAGQLDVAIVAGGEARWRDRQAARAGTVATVTDDAGAEPDERLRPHGEIISAQEIDARLVSAVSHYALIENARRFADGQSPAEHRRQIDGLWARFGAVAANNDDAWYRDGMSAAELGGNGPDNRPLALPYHKWHVSQWTVNQAGALVLCSVEAARAHGVAPDRWVFCHGLAESNTMVPVSRRAALARCPGFAVTGREALSLSGIGVDDVAHVDLYSCFPIAVRAQARELGLADDRQLTVTGGMTFAGGPLNNYVVQSLAKVAGVLRRHPADYGLVTAVSGMLTKQAVSVWSCRPPRAGYRFADVSDEVDRVTGRAQEAGGEAGPATIATYTVLYDRGQAQRAVVIADDADGRRSLACATDEMTVGAMTDDEWIGRRIELDGRGGFTLD